MRRIDDAARLVQIAHVTASRDDPIATCLVPRDRFSGRALAYGARTHLLCPTPACGREGLDKTRKTRRRTRVPFVSVARGPVRPLWRSMAVRERFGCGETKVVYFLRVFQTANPARHDRVKPSSRPPMSVDSLQRSQRNSSPSFLVKREGSRFELGTRGFIFRARANSQIRRCVEFSLFHRRQFRRATRDLLLEEGISR